MKAKSHKITLDIFAKFLILLSFFIFGIGFSYDANFNDNNLKQKNNTKKVHDEGPSVSITTSDDVDIINANGEVTPINEEDVISSSTYGDNTISNNDGVDETQSDIKNQGETSNKVEENDLNVVNNQLRKEIENTYNISVKYGSETDNYYITGSGATVKTYSINNPSVINNSLIRLRNVLSLYPKDMFKEINDGGIPLSIYLINNYSEENITGATDSSFSYACISLAVKYPLEETFYHESYHYIERYMFKKGANFNTWNSLNPEGFTYGTIYNGNSYSNTFSEDAPFVNNYAQSEDAEDRASTFEYMMATSKASCLNNGNTVWKKAILMSRTIDAVFDTVSPDVTEYWERFLN